MLYLFIFIICFCLASAWVGGIDDMQKNHPDYDGSDLFDE